MNDYKERMKTEYKELAERHDKLRKMITRCRIKPKYALDGSPLSLLIEQADIMRKYLDILETRAGLEGVNLLDE
ncbi:hypothetical protein AAK979_10700 [Ileibacterium valens]|uniref:crAss001_48 related protein n=1 Tax=Ileibacterium valens TaxID=1862668 RepID=UPI00351246EA